MSIEQAKSVERFVYNIFLLWYKICKKIEYYQCIISDKKPPVMGGFVVIAGLLKSEIYACVWSEVYCSTALEVPTCFHINIRNFCINFPKGTKPRRRKFLYK